MQEPIWGSPGEPDRKTAEKIWDAARNDVAREVAEQRRQMRSQIARDVLAFMKDTWPEVRLTMSRRAALVNLIENGPGSRASTRGTDPESRYPPERNPGY